MTSLNTIQTSIDNAEDLIGEAFYSDTWRATSYLIQILCKTESYYNSLSESNPDGDYYTAQIATSSALELINNSYNVPTDDDRFELVETGTFEDGKSQMYDEMEECVHMLSRRHRQDVSLEELKEITSLCLDLSAVDVA